MKRRLFSIALAALLLAAAGPGWAEEPAAATVNGTVITEETLRQRMEASAAFNRQADDKLSDDEKTARDAALREAALTALIEETALLQEADRRGLNASALRTDIEERFRAMVGAVASYVLTTYPDLEGDALTAQVESLLAATGASLDSYYEAAVRASILGALDEQLLSEAAQPGEAELRAAYDALWTEQKAAFDADENAYEAALLQGSVVVYRPRPVKLIQKAEFLFDSGAAALIAQTEQGAPEAAAEMRRDQQSRAKARADQAAQALAKGEKTFPEVLAELGQAETVNYFHPDSTRFGAEYYTRAAAFQTVGEVSSLYEMTNGYALLCYAGDLPACQRVAYEEVSERLREAWAAERQEDALREAKAALLAAAEIVRNGDTSK